MAAQPCLSLSGTDLAEEITEMRAELLRYTPGSASTCPDRVEFPRNLYIGLFGRTGCGKTSLINSLKFAAKGKLRPSKWNQAAGQEKAGGHTMLRKLADITKRIFVIDNRGLDEPNTKEAIKEITLQLDGKRGYSDFIEWQKCDADEGDDDEDFDLNNLNPGSEHSIGCVIFVFSAGHDIETNINGLSDVVDFLHQHQGRYPVAVITHVDVAEKDHVEALKAVLQVSGVSDIFEVANLTKEKQLLEEPYQHSLLSLLDRCMTDGDETFIFKYYQRIEQQRKREIEKKKEEKKEEKKLKQDEKRQDEERQQTTEREGVLREKEMMLEQQRQLAEKLEKEKRDLGLALVIQKLEIDSRERREKERELRYQAAIAKLEAKKKEELDTIMKANKNHKKESRCAVM